MKKTLIKLSFIIMLILILLFTIVFTYLNVSKYASVMNINVVFISFSLIIPIYHSFKQKMYTIKMSIYIYLYFIIILIIFSFIIPKYDYNEVIVNLENEVYGKSEELVIKHTKESSFFYQGKYKIKINGIIYSHELSNYTYSEYLGE